MIDPAVVREAFEDRHGRAPRLFWAPGRVNLIGEHTDYNDGFVLPVAIERGTVVAAAARQDSLVRVHSMNTASSIEIDLDRPGPARRGTWNDYVEGVAQALRERGVRVGGADMVLESDVPAGAGLSSSASLEIATGLALATVSGADVDRVALALAGQAAEHRWVGTQCGIMDQFIASLGRARHALLIDCRSLEPTYVPLDDTRAAVVVCDSRVKHELASSAYNERRDECTRGAAILGARALRDVTPEAFAANEAKLPEPVRRRCRHVVTEDARTLAAVDALRAGNLDEVGRLMLASHRSLRDDYEVSCAELDALVDAAMEVPGVFGARMTGGGFGGCTVSLVAHEALPAFERSVKDRFAARFGRAPEIFVCRPSDGARELPRGDQK